MSRVFRWWNNLSPFTQVEIVVSFYTFCLAYLLFS